MVLPDKVPCVSQTGPYCLSFDCGLNESWAWAQDKEEWILLGNQFQTEVASWRPLGLLQPAERFCLAYNLNFLKLACVIKMSKLDISYLKIPIYLIYWKAEKSGHWSFISCKIMKDPWFGIRHLFSGSLQSPQAPSSMHFTWLDLVVIPACVPCDGLSHEGENKSGQCEPLKCRPYLLTQQSQPMWVTQGVFLLSLV